MRPGCRRAGRGAAQHAIGWPHFLGRLRTPGRGDDPGPDPFESSTVRRCQPGMSSSAPAHPAVDGQPARLAFDVSRAVALPLRQYSDRSGVTRYHPDLTRAVRR